MGITVEREVARADINDEGGVTVWQETPELALSIEQAREHAESILRAAAEAVRVRMDDVHESSGGYPFIVAASGEAVL